MIPCVLETLTCHPPVAPVTAVTGGAHLADVVRWAGLAVSVAGAFEATPEGTVRVWQRAVQLARRVRAWLPWRRPESASVSPVTAAGSVTIPKVRVSGYGTVRDPNAPSWEQVRALAQMHQQLEGRVAALQQETRELTE